MSETTPLEFRRGTTRDRSFVRKISAEVFSRFGPYERMLPPLIEDPTVATWIIARNGEPIGFTMWSRLTPADPVAELTAIAVSPREQARGVGGLLLEKVEGEVRRAVPPIVRLRLTVADDNCPARRLFERSGFDYLDEELGLYYGGQVSLGMIKELKNGSI